MAARGARAPRGTGGPHTAAERRVGGRGAGRVETGVTRAIRAAREGAAADPRLAGLESLARTLAAGVDIAADQPYALAQLSPRLLDVLETLMLIPRTTHSDALTQLLADIATPTVPDDEE
ncbi:hypothetical protein GCM10009802_20260 [Streptomyces synnematoformans]|uniref:Uncharacterized protein n=1 Tax=Streptomyces synnematoformans TaxID=415721 RepID=A0ABP5JKQ0_9ACTN